jgi:hypothetical protein
MLIHLLPQAFGVRRGKHISERVTIAAAHVSGVNRLGVAQGARIDPDEDGQISISDTN